MCHLNYTEDIRTHVRALTSVHRGINTETERMYVCTIQFFQITVK